MVFYAAISIYVLPCLSRDRSDRWGADFRCLVSNSSPPSSVSCCRRQPIHTEIGLILYVFDPASPWSAPGSSAIHFPLHSYGCKILCTLHVAIPGQLSSFDNFQQAVKTANIASDFFQDCCICSMSSVWNVQQSTVAAELKCTDTLLQALCQRPCFAAVQETGGHQGS